MNEVLKMKAIHEVEDLLSQAVTEKNDKKIDLARKFNLAYYMIDILTHDEYKRNQDQIMVASIKLIKSK